MEMYNLREEEVVVDSRKIASLMNGVFMWMFAGILVTIGAMVAVVTSPVLLPIVASSVKVIVIVQFLVAMGMSFLINKISPLVAKGLFLLYAAMTGVTFSLLLFIFTFESVMLALGLTALIFGAMAVYGYVTKEDLSRFGSLLMVGLIVLVIASVANIFLNLPMMSMIIGYIGVLLFTALIGYDVNRIKAGLVQMAYSGAGNGEMDKYSVFGAFSIYLDFINLFMSIMRIIGVKR